MSHTDESNELLREIRDLLAKQEEKYQNYLADMRREYDAYLQKSKVDGKQVGALTLWLFVVMLAANVFAGWLLKGAAFFDVATLEIM